MGSANVTLAYIQCRAFGRVREDDFPTKHPHQPARRPHPTRHPPVLYRGDCFVAYARAAVARSEILCLVNCFVQRSMIVGVRRQRQPAATAIYDCQSYLYVRALCQSIYYSPSTNSQQEQLLYPQTLLYKSFDQYRIRLARELHFFHQANIKPSNHQTQHLQSTRYLPTCLSWPLTAAKSAATSSSTTTSSLTHHNTSALQSTAPA